MSSYTPRSIRAMAALLKMDDGDYRNMLKDNYGVQRTRELSPSQLQEFGSILYQKLNGKSAWNNRHQDLGVRTRNRATPAQLRALEVMWNTVSVQQTIEAKHSALDTMCKRITGVQSIRWISKKQAHDLMLAIQAMGAQTPEQHNQQEASHG